MAQNRSGWLGRFFQAIIILPALLILQLALSYHFTGTTLTILRVLIGLAVLGIAVLWVQGRGWMVWLSAVVVVAAGLVWFNTLQPTNDAEWDPDVAHGVTAEIDGNVVTMHNVRNFDWITNEEFIPRWETRTYQLDQLTEIDLFTSVWGNPNIAHIMVGFGFSDGQHVVFSVETRRQAGQIYTTLGGLFRLYTLVLIAADERDVIRWRTDVRDDPTETVSIFPLDMKPEKKRELFLKYIGMGNDLEDTPEFYNTATTNCSTVPWHMARAAGAAVPLNWKILASAHFPEYLHDLGVLSPGEDIQQVMLRARLGKLGPAIPDGIEFSRRLRIGQES